MIYPTPRSVLLTALGAPAALLLALIAPSLWVGGLAWSLVVVLLTLADGLGAPSGSALTVEIEHPPATGVGEPFTVSSRLRFGGSRAPTWAEVALAVDARLSADGGAFGATDLIDGAGKFDTSFTADRRGNASIDRMWLRWQGPLGLAWRQKEEMFDLVVPVLPSIAQLHDRAVRLDIRDLSSGLIAQREHGAGSEFDALTEFEPGMDRRSIDWKQSARHTELLAKEYRSERNNHIVLAIDTGRTMSEPIDGLPRLDRALSAALVTGWTALKLGDRVSLLGFAARPETTSPTVSGTAGFTILQQAAAGLDYRAEETNYTLAMITLAARLRHRALIVIFTDFADPTSAELLLRAAGPLIERHMVLFVVMRDNELEMLADAEPGDSLDVSRAVAATALLRQRAVVITRLRRLGGFVVEAPHEAIGTKLLDSYLDMKRRSLV